MKHLLKFMFPCAVLALLVSAPPLHAESTAPDFSLPDVSGVIHNLKDQRGQIVVLEWTNFLCPFVVKHYSSGNMQALQEKYIAEGIVWYVICSSKPGSQGYYTLEELPAMIETQKAVPSAYLVDADGTVGRAYGAKTTPHMFIIDAEGNLVYDGAIDDKPSTSADDIPQSKNYVQEILDALLAGETVEAKTTKPYGCSVKY